MDREESKERKDKRITMAQWVNRLWNNSFKSDVITFAVLNFWSRTPGLTAGWLAGRRNPCDFRDFQNSL